MVSAIRSEVEAAKKRTNDQASGLKLRCDTLETRVHDVEVKVLSGVGIGKLGEGVKAMQKSFVSSLMVPLDGQQGEAQKLAHRLLQQACEMSALLCGGQALHGEDAQEIRALRAKHKSSRQLREVCRLLVGEKVQDVLGRPPGGLAQSAVYSALHDVSNSTSTGGGFLGSPSHGMVMQPPPHHGNPHVMAGMQLPFAPGMHAALPPPYSPFSPFGGGVPAMTHHPLGNGRV
jgi:hypothetical protein